MVINSAQVSRPALSPWLALLAPLLAIVLYMNVVDNPLHPFDTILTTLNPQVNPAYYAGTTTSAWLNPTPTAAAHSAYYRPVLMLLLRFEYIAWGDSPSSFHMFSLVLFIAAIVLMLLLTAELIPHRAGRALAVLAFVVHPMATQSVQSIGGQGVLLALVCLLDAGFWLVRYRQGRRSLKWTAVALPLLAFIGAGAHELGLLIPVMLLALAYAPLVVPPVPHRAPLARDVARKKIKGAPAQAPAVEKPPLNPRLVYLILALPLVLIVALNLLLRHFALGAMLPTDALREARALGRSLLPNNAGSVVLTYLARLVYPSHPTLYYAPLYEPSLLLPAALGCGVMLALIAAGLFALVRRSLFGVALVWLLLPLLALAQILTLPITFSEEALLFALPGFGWCIGLIASAVMQPNWMPGRTHMRDALVIALAACAGAALAFQTWQRGHQWKSVEGLYQAEVALHPDSPQPQTDLLRYYVANNQSAKAMEIIPQARTHARGGDLDTLIEAQASFLSKQGDTVKLGDLLDDEIITTRTAIRGHFEQLASQAEKNKMADRAEALWRRELVLDPTNTNALGSMADAAVRHQDFKQALTYAEKAAHLSSPALRAGTLAHYGQIMAQTGNFKEAIAQFNEALKADGTLYLPYQFMIRIYATQGNLDTALNLVNFAFQHARVATYAELAEYYVLIEERMGKGRDAPDAMMRIVQSHPADLELRILAAKYTLERHRWSLAENLLYSLRTLNDKRQADVLDGLAFIKLARDHDSTSAQHLLEQALQADPDNRDAARMLEELRNGEAHAPTGLAPAPSNSAQPLGISAMNSTGTLQQPAGQAPPAGALQDIMGSGDKSNPFQNDAAPVPGAP